MQNWLVLLPEISLLSFFPISFLVNKYRTSKTSKTFFTLSRISVLSAILFTVIFYNQSYFPYLWINNKYSTLFKLLTYFSSFVWFYLSSKWFLNKSRSSYNFYNLAMGMTFLFGIVISAQNLLTIIFCVPLLCLFTYYLILQHWDEGKVKQTANQYFYLAVFFMFSLCLGTLIIRYFSGSFEFSKIKDWLEVQSKLPLIVYLGLVLILSALLFMMGAVPFHLWFVDVIGLSVLPVCGFLSIIPPLAYLSCFITLISEVMLPIRASITPLLQTVAILSLLVGALSANIEHNIRRLFAFSTIYNLGFMLLGVISFRSGAILSAFVYTIIYVMTMIGIYTVFLGLKSKGDYRSDIKDISGMSEIKPYLSASFLVFMVSIIGIPPMLGFWGRLSLIDTLVIEERWVEVSLIFIALIIIANAFLQIIRRIYFESLTIHYDRTDKSIYICLFINLTLVIISILSPSYLLADAESILIGVR